MKINKKTFFIILIFTIFIIYLFSNKKKEIIPSIISTNPTNLSTNVSEKIQLEVNFDESIDEKSKSKININIYPQTDYETTWLANTYKIIPKNQLQNNTKYIIGILYNKSEFYNFSFETQLFKTEDILKYGPTQTENDLEFARVSKTIIEKYPWYIKLPIITSDYTIYYDFENQMFAVTLLKKSNNLKIIDSEIPKQLKAIGVEKTNNYYFNF